MALDEGSGFFTRMSDDGSFSPPFRASIKALSPMNLLHLIKIEKESASMYVVALS